MADFTLDDLVELAGEKSYQRGLGYIDAVQRLSADDAEIHAQVIGTSRYRVHLWLDGEGVTGSCDCPWGEDGNFCKHCVAVGVVYLYEREHGDEVPEPTDLRSHLESLDHAALVDLLLEAAERDERLFDRVRQNWERAEHEYQVGEAATELAAAHRDACTAAKPEPVALAEGSSNTGWQVIEQLDRMDRHGEAVERAEAALMPGRVDQRTVDFLDEHYRVEDDREALVSLHRKRFECAPGRHSYEALAVLDEPELLSWAVDHVRDELEGGTSKWGLADLLAWMLLDQDRITESWEAANRYRALPEVRIEVAKHHRHTDPEACSELFMARADVLIEQRNKHSYEAAAELVALAAACLSESIGPEVGETYVAELRAAHRRKRNLMAALDARGLS